MGTCARCGGVSGWFENICNACKKTLQEKYTKDHTFTYNEQVEVYGKAFRVKAVCNTRTLRRIRCGSFRRAVGIAKGKLVAICIGPLNQSPDKISKTPLLLA